MTRLSLLERRLRIVTGLILATYITQHLVNHMLGLVSFEAMETMRRTVTPFWRSWFGGLLIYGSLLTHFGLALLSLYRRTTLRIPFWELAQLLLGLSIVPLLAGHVAATWGARVLLGYDINYEYALSGILSNDWIMTKQAMLLLVAWSHVVLGLHFFFRLFRWYKNWKMHLYPLVLLIPLLVMLSMGRIGADLGVWDSAPAPEPYPGEFLLPEQAVEAADEYVREKPANLVLRDSILFAFYALLALVLVARTIRGRIKKRKSGVIIRHINGRVLTGIPGQSILEVIRSHSIPHASLCGGRGRCATCRVRIGLGFDELAKPSPLERSALRRIAAAPNVRLACQTRPTMPLEITPLMSPDLHVDDEWREGGVSGEERDVVALFVDLRGSSRFSQRHLPYDVLFILNRFFLEMSAALNDSHGHYAQFEGDGLLALYGLERGLEQGCRDVLRGAVAMQQRIDRLNELLRHELKQPLRVGIGIHCGQAIVGTMGPPSAPNYSAIGDCVNAAARLESMTKEFDCIMVVSAEVVRQAGTDFGDIRRQTVELYGKQKSVPSFVVDDMSRVGV